MTVEEMSTEDEKIFEQAMAIADLTEDFLHFHDEVLQDLDEDFANRVRDFLKSYNSPTQEHYPLGDRLVKISILYGFFYEAQKNLEKELDLLWKICK